MASSGRAGLRPALGHGTGPLRERRPQGRRVRRPQRGRAVPVPHRARVHRSHEEARRAWISTMRGEGVTWRSLRAARSVSRSALSDCGRRGTEPVEEWPVEHLLLLRGLPHHPRRAGSRSPPSPAGWCPKPKRSRETRLVAASHSLTASGSTTSCLPVWSS